MSTTYESSSHHRAGGGGVADYYAMLGVGDSLVWQHRQKQSEHDGLKQQQQQQHEADGSSNSTDGVVAQGEQDGTTNADDAEDVERFGREIVCVAIVERQYVEDGNNDIHVVNGQQSTATDKVEDDRHAIPALPSCDSSSVGTTTNPFLNPRVPLHQERPSSTTSMAVTEEERDDGTWNVVRRTLPITTAGSNGSWDANLDWDIGLRSTVLEQTQNTTMPPADATATTATVSDRLQGLSLKTTNDSSRSGKAPASHTAAFQTIRHSVETKWKRFHQQQPTKANDTSMADNEANNVPFDSPQSDKPLVRQFYLSYQRRRQVNILDGQQKPGIADVQVVYVRLHQSLLVSSIDRCHTVPNGPLTPSSPSTAGMNLDNVHGWGKLVLLEDYLTDALPPLYNEWSIPESYQWIRDPVTVSKESSGVGSSALSADSLMPQLVPLGVAHAPRTHDHCCIIPVLVVRRQRCGEEERFHEDPAIIDLAISFAQTDVNTVPVDGDDDDNMDEDTAGTFCLLGQTPWSASTLVHANTVHHALSSPPSIPVVQRRSTGVPIVLARKNVPSGFADAAFATRVLGRFPLKNYHGLPLPEEELPMFCYPTGCRLVRSAFSDAPLPQYYGFVVKNERGDSIYVSCVSFMEPLTVAKVQQLAKLSERRQRTSLPHQLFCQKRQQKREKSVRGEPLDCGNDTIGNSRSSDATTEAGSNVVLTAFGEMTTFENKTICLVSRYPFWTAFRKFLSHLHILSGSVLDLPLERYISHLLLSVPLPRPGGPSVLVPLPALNEPMILTMPPEKDLPLLNLPYHRLFACLDIKTIVTIVLGVLSLERKVILLSTHPSLVLDVCELLRSLLFPFELCAPYVPRLTEPFKGSLNFPGAIFVGIHDDGDPHGLASVVKATFPEESIIVDLDTGKMDCDGDRYDVLTGLWNIIPKNPRSLLVAELEALCKDASIVDGQEPLDSLLDSAFYVDLTDAVECYDVSAESTEALDDRAIRDAFLRFFCSVLGGYERFLVVPDADFLVSGNEWFDAQGFLASVPTANAAYVTSLVSTQLFQSFIQRRTEASDVHCMLFDECVIEFHSSPVPYGRLGGDVETVHHEGSSQPQILFSLLVDQSSATTSGHDQATILQNRSMDASEADSSFSLNLSRASASVCDSSVKYSETHCNGAGDLVTAPSRQDLRPGEKFVYCLDGNPCYPHELNADLFLPSAPTSWTIDMAKAPDPLLARSDREIEEANRRRRMATSHRGSNQRRCLWQLPKLMGSHFLGSWLLCIPAMVSQLHLSNDQQSRHLLRALGALRLLRSKQRIVPDEAAYRALMVACGRTRSDRRVELVKLFGLLRSDGIFPSAVTLGQYTKALAEGYSKRLSGTLQDEDFGLEVTESGSKLGRVSETAGQQRSVDLESSLYNLDTSLKALELQGRKWRHGQSDERGHSTDNGDEPITEPKNKHFSSSRTWLPVVYSSSFLSNAREGSNDRSSQIRLIAIWSRNRGCTGCSYIPLEEEIQAGWDVAGEENEIPGAIHCPRCGSLIVPMLGFKEMSIECALNLDALRQRSITDPAPSMDADPLPPQIRPNVEVAPFDDDVGFVAYVNPSTLRESLEQHVEKYGEEVLERESLRQLDPEAYYNFWWYCARFSLPLPLPVSSNGVNACAFAAWDRSVAERGCYSVARILRPLLPQDVIVGEPMSPSCNSLNPGLFDEAPLLSRFNLQGFYSSVWEHPDLQQLLVSLVEACDKDSLRQVVECLISINQQRKASATRVAREQNLHELDVYRTILYLAKYQCTTVFQAFFPATLKPCKGYHFWCAIGTPLPIFDRMLRDAMRRVHQKESNIALPMHHVSDVAVAFRCVFGHLI